MTETKARKLLHRIWFHHRRLQRALDDAHHYGLIDFKEYGTEAPCWAMHELRARIERTTKEKIAALIQDAVRREAR